METLYFAYGSNMDAAQMARRCPSATIVGPATLDGYRFIIMRRGYATVVPSAGAVVHGLLWRLADADQRALDTYEGVTEGHYRRERLAVVHESRGCTALVYIGTDDAPGRPKPGYLERVVAAARTQGLPPDYLRQLSAWHRPPDDRMGP